LGTSAAPQATRSAALYLRRGAASSGREADIISRNLWASSTSITVLMFATCSDPALLSPFCRATLGMLLHRLDWRAVMACALRGWLTVIALIFAAIGPAAAEPKRVLLLHSFGPQFVPWTFFAAQFREELFKRSPDKIDLYEASLESSRFQQPEEQRPIVDYLVALFGKRRLDLIVTIGAPATFFVQKYRQQSTRHRRTGATGNRLQYAYVE
jgi:hypothetical protein